MSDYLINRANATDVHDVAVLYNRYVRESTATFQSRVVPDEKVAEWLLRPPPHGGFVARDPNDHRLLGYLTLAPFIERCAARWSVEVAIYLAAEACGRGIGSALLASAESTARDHHLHTIVAVICTENSGSCRFFRRQGFLHCGTIEMVAQKFGRRLGVEYYQKILPQSPCDE